MVHWTQVINNSNQSQTLNLNPIGQSNVFFRLTPSTNFGSRIDFQVGIAGRMATVGSGVLRGSDGSETLFQGGSVSLRPSATNYLVVNYGTLRLHNLRRWVGDGEQLIATIITSASGVLQVIRPDSFSVPPSRIGRAKSILAARLDSLRVVTLGDSLTEISPQVNWRTLLFDESQIGRGLHVDSGPPTFFWNLGLSSSTPAYGLALLSRACQSAGQSKLGWGIAANPSDFFITDSNTVPSSLFPLRTQSHYWDFAPDLTIVSYGVNADLYNPNNIESIARILIQDQGQSAIFTTENDFAILPRSDAILNGLLPIRDSIGGAIADTAAYVDEVNDNGTNTYVDSIHQNEAGWTAWAEAIYGVLNPLPQSALSVPIVSNRVVKAVVPSEEEYLGVNATVVGGLPLEMSSGTHFSGSAKFKNANYLPGLFQVDSLVGVPGKTGSFTNYVTYSHHCWNWAALIFERGVGIPATAANGFLGQGTNSFVGYCTWIDAVGAEHFLSSFRYDDDKNVPNGPFPRPGMITLARITDMYPAMSNLSESGITQPGMSNRWISGSLRIYITDGNAWITGVLFGGPKYDDLILNPATPEFNQPNPWKSEVPFGESGLHRWLYFDSPGLDAEIYFQGNGIQLMLLTGPSACNLNLHGNGAPLPDLNLQSPRQSPKMLQWFPPASTNSSQFLDIGLNSDGMSPVPPSSGNHRMTMFKASVFK